MEAVSWAVETLAFRAGRRKTAGDTDADGSCELGCGDTYFPSRTKEDGRRQRRIWKL